MIRSRHAFTLIELLVAMGIAVLLAAVVFAIYAGALRTLDSQSRWRAAAYPASAALDALLLDLTGAVIPWGITNPPFVLTTSPDGADGIKLHFFAAVPQNTAQTQDLSCFGPDVRAYAMREMDYTLSVSDTLRANGLPPSEARGQRAVNGVSGAVDGLIRTWTAFRIDETGGIVSNKDVYKNVRAIRLEVFNGKNWTNTWDGGTNASLPQAARVMLTVGDASVSRRIAAEVLIPAGHRIAAPKSKILKTD
ncbi:MAG: prepilin-type N-terminal cleavage/methylation domain-containing protein [Verrucomicrobiota bacterium]